VHVPDPAVLEIVLEDATIVLSGRVIDPDGRPIEGARVTLSVLEVSFSASATSSDGKRARARSGRASRSLRARGGRVDPGRLARIEQDGEGEVSKAHAGICEGGKHSVSAVSAGILRLRPPGSGPGGLNEIGRSCPCSGSEGSRCSFPWCSW
jgi:hypothetical protein